MAVLILWLTPYGFFFLKYYRFLFCKICFLLFESKNLNLHISPFFYKLKQTKSYFVVIFVQVKLKLLIDKKNFFQNEIVREILQP